MATVAQLERRGVAAVLQTTGEHHYPSVTCTSTSNLESFSAQTATAGSAPGEGSTGLGRQQ